MAKKSKRSVSTVSPVEQAAPATYSRTPFPTTRASYTSEFKPDYSLVISDLKRIGVLAGAFTVILIALSFFLR